MAWAAPPAQRPSHLLPMSPVCSVTYVPGPDRGAQPPSELTRCVGALQERDQLLAELGGEAGLGLLTETAGGVDGALVGIDEGHAGRAAVQVPFELRRLIRGERPVDVIREQLDAFRAPDLARRSVHLFPLAGEATTCSETLTQGRPGASPSLAAGVA